MGNDFGFLTLGVGDAFSSRHYASSFVVGFEGSWLLVDCPHPIRKMLSEASDAAGMKLDLDDIDALVLTHLHADHCSGVEGFLYYNHFALARRPRVVAHPDVSERLWSGHLAAGMDKVVVDATGKQRSRGLADFAVLQDLSDDDLSEGGETEVGPFRIACRKTRHSIPTTALRIRAGGRCLGYSADTSFDPTLIDWLSDADLFVHETNLGIHTDYAELAKLPAPVRERMRLIHYPDFFDVAGSVIEPLREGRWYSV